MELDLTEEIARAMFPATFDELHEVGPTEAGAHGIALKYAGKILARLDSLGLVVVPKEPSDAMAIAGYHAINETKQNFSAKCGCDWSCSQSAIYRAMLAAS